ncbi:hypothetical protein DPEC_G00253870 [Dallia pectoralis]|uniref:Uncharacterized protein n=1 Tax=Dallia pectoralis TaxID=75939 RepID=A0ACC2FU60_DALPE|nr:hypothetical protein DPEC_G00253870 [Dallia pectoralis]
MREHRLVLHMGPTFLRADRMPPEVRTPTPLPPNRPVPVTSGAGAPPAYRATCEGGALMSVCSRRSFICILQRSRASARRSAGLLAVPGCQRLLHLNVPSSGRRREAGKRNHERLGSAPQPL